MEGQFSEDLFRRISILIEKLKLDLTVEGFLEAERAIGSSTIRLSDLPERMVNAYIDGSLDAIEREDFPIT